MATERNRHQCLVYYSQRVESRDNEIMAHAGFVQSQLICNMAYITLAQDLSPTCLGRQVILCGIMNLGLHPAEIVYHLHVVRLETVLVFRGLL